jgi:pimeloyl-ACP methyl ester carboxylesterase
MNVTSIWREALAAFEGVDLYLSRPELARDVMHGDGTPVLLLPGYLAGDRSLAPLSSWIERIGYAPQQAAISTNVDCATRTTRRLVERLETITETHGDRALIVGHSLGGVLGRLLAVRRPDLVRGVVCLGSPLLNLNAVHPLLWANVRLMGVLGDLHVPGVLTRACLNGACCAESRSLLRAPLPEDVGLVSIYSRGDGIVDWRACLDPEAQHIEVKSTHLGLPVNAAVYRALGECLADLADAARPPYTLAAAA